MSVQTAAFVEWGYGTYFQAFLSASKTTESVAAAGVEILGSRASSMHVSKLNVLDQYWSFIIGVQLYPSAFP